MEILGYIVSSGKINESVGFVEVVKSYDEIKDPTKPILIIGLNEAKKFTDGFSILNKKIDENIFWTFSKYEKRNDYEKDILSFYEYLLKSNIESINYHYFNIINAKYSSIKKIINFVKKSEDKYIYISNDMLYIYMNNYVIGISLAISSYCGVNKTKILSKLHSNKSNIISYNDFFVDNKLKKIINNKKYVIPYFMKIYEVKNE